MRRHIMIGSIASNALLLALCVAGCGDWLTGPKLSDNPTRASSATSDVTVLPLVVDAAMGPLDRPSDGDLDADIDRFAITPLFDGESLERI